MAEKVRLAQVGLGGWGRSLSRGLTAAENVEVVAAYDIDSDTLKDATERLGWPAASSYDEVLADGRVQGVVTVTPNHTHRELAVQAAEAGKSIFVDKPIANTLEDADAMIDACRSARVVLAVGHSARRYGAVRAMKAEVDKGSIGQVVMVEAHTSHTGGLRVQPDQWRWKRELCPGGPLMQLGVHHADTLQYLLGHIENVCAIIRRVATPAEIDDVASVALEFESGIVGYLGDAYSTPKRHFISIYGTEGHLTWSRGSALVLDRDGEKQELEFADTDAVREEVEDFANAIANDGCPEVSGEEARRALAVILAAIQSAETRTFVDPRRL